jgi:hypothetical protein
LPLGSPVPNNVSGWGRIDAFAAVAAVADHGTVVGTVTRTGGDVPVAGATLIADPSTPDARVTTLTAHDGSYLLALAPDR